MFQISDSLMPYKEGIEELIKQYATKTLPCTIKVEAECSSSSLIEVDFNGSVAVIKSKEKVHFFLGFMLLLQRLHQTEKLTPFHIEKNAYFHSFGVMLDCSRNAVLTVDSIKKYIRFLASIGMNVLMLYTEDTYEVENYPYFGAYRGKYTKSELMECDNYANLFGIEIIPCIQTLAHLRCALRWKAMSALTDTEDILYVESPHVIEFLQQILRSASEPFRSKRIHLGMDEAHYLGLGKYLHDNGFTNREDLMMTHLNRVQSICEELQLESIIWSDMFFRINSPTGDYYDMPDNLDLSHIKLPSDCLHLTYWDYYHHDTAFYEKFLRLHQQMDPGCWFAGGGWIWNGLVPNFTKAFHTTECGLNACKQINIQNAICTMWQDAGAETPHEAGLPSVLYFAEHGFSNSPSLVEMKERLFFLTGIPYNAYMFIDALDTHPDLPKDTLDVPNPSKYCLYQDPLIALFDEQIKDYQLGNYYHMLSDKLGSFLQYGQPLLHYYHTLSKVLSIKADLGNRIYEAYHSNDKNTLELIILKDIPTCISYVRILKDAREELWFSENKPFGYEVIDIRFGGIMTRLTSVQKRIQMYLDSQINSLAELEETRLTYTGSSKKELPFCNLWERIITAGNAAGI
ncbi:beta-N-acetylhexosaminidase [Anaerocolumna sp.]|uniref:beta-N-acetylhexosaminidase n=1 Tax=Anaerocolumna sp. TaxID=2041569 RepID=UPI0028A9286C|nr:beta-N-acetylhexosaminidase [Anaerocolumna sp.]